MDTNCCSSGGGGDEGNHKKLNPNNGSTVNTTTSTVADLKTSILPVEDKVVVVEEKEETRGGIFLEETPCVCAACCCPLERIPLTNEDNSLFRWFLRWFRFDRWQRTLNTFNFKWNRGEWDGGGGESLKFCEPCKEEVLRLQHIQRRWSSRKGVTKFKKELHQMRIRLRGYEPEFEANRIYVRDNRYFLLRIKFCKLTSPIIGGCQKKKKVEGTIKRDLEDQEEDREDREKIRMSSRVKRPLSKFSPQISTAKIRKVENQVGKEEEEVEQESGMEGEVQVKLEDWPEEFEDLEVDNYWLNDDSEIGEMVKIEDTSHDPPKCRTAMYSSKNGHHQENNCLFCYKAMSPEEIQLKPVLTNDLVEANLNTFFILRKMLQIPKSKLTSYLVTCGDPQNWIQFCRTCLSVVDEAQRIQKGIEELENTLRKLQNEMVDKINSTCSDDGGYQRKLLRDPKSVSMVTEETRQFIYWKSRTPATQLSQKFPVLFKASTSPSSSPQPPLTNSRLPSSLSTNRKRKVVPFKGKVPSKNKMSKVVMKKKTKKKKMEKQKTDESAKRTSLLSEMMVKMDEIKRVAPSPQNGRDRDNARRLQGGNYLCSLCPSLKKPMSLVQFYAHVIFHYKRRFKCAECNLYWSSHTELEKSPFNKEKCVNGEHTCSKETLVEVGDYQPGYLWKCAGCPETFSKEIDRDLHKKAECPNKLRIPNEVTYKCIQCSDDKQEEEEKGYRNYEEWLLHRVLEHTETAITSCMFCDERCGIKTTDGIDHFDITAMKTHVTSEHPSWIRTTMYPTDICDFCGVTFKTSVQLGRHLEKLHGVDGSKAMSCRICYYRTALPSYLKRHVETSHAVHRREKVEREICDVCGVKLHKPGAMALADHKLLKHGIEPSEEFQKRMKTCQMEGCGFRSLDLTNFKKHMMKMHGAERSHKCSICGKGFFDSGKLAQHLKIHKNKETKPYQCEICGNSFALRNYLYIHMRLSHLNRPFASTHKKRRPAGKRMNRGAEERPAHHSQPASQFPSQLAQVP